MPPLPDSVYGGDGRRRVKKMKKKKRKKKVERELSAASRRSKLSVLVRVRPLLSHEESDGHKDILENVGDNVVVLMNPHFDISDVLRKNRAKEKRFAFDRTFHKSQTQKDVYTHSTKPLLKGVLNGYNATVFAYGPTGAGKTYTMLGTPQHPGIMSQTVNDLFKLVERRKEEIIYEVSLTYVELYNEHLYDLLVDSSSELELREDSQGNSVICGARSVAIQHPKQVMDLLTVGNARRSQEATAANSTSSRSHAILCLKVRQRSVAIDVKQTYKIGSLYLCDLAGSERAAHTKNVGLRMVEGQHINRSLLALGNCINSLAANVKAKYINYRDSKLTRLLKHALGGNCRTVMIAHVSPCDFHFEETYNTLVYANRAKNIKTKVVKNTQQVQAHITEYANIINALKTKVSELQNKLEHSRPRTSTSTTSSISNAVTNSNATSTEHEDDVVLNTVMTFQRELNGLIDEVLDLQQQLHETQHEAIQVVLQAREQTISALVADGGEEDEAAAIVGREDDPQITQLVDDQVMLAKPHVHRIEEAHANIKAMLELCKDRALQLVENAIKGCSSDPFTAHVLEQLHGLFLSKFALASAESSRTTLQQYLTEAQGTIQQLRAQAESQALLIQKQAALLAEHGVNAPETLAMEQQQAIVDTRVNLAMEKMEAQLPLMCLDPEEILRRTKMRRLRQQQQHKHLHNSYISRMKTIAHIDTLPHHSNEVNVKKERQTTFRQRSARKRHLSHHSTHEHRIQDGLEERNSVDFSSMMSREKTVTISGPIKLLPHASQSTLKDNHERNSTLSPISSWDDNDERGDDVEDNHKDKSGGKVTRRSTHTILKEGEKQEEKGKSRKDGNLQSVMRGMGNVSSSTPLLSTRVQSSIRKEGSSNQMVANGNGHRRKAPNMKIRKKSTNSSPTRNVGDESLTSFSTAHTNNHSPPLLNKTFSTAPLAKRSAKDRDGSITSRDTDTSTNDQSIGEDGEYLESDGDEEGDDGDKYGFDAFTDESDYMSEVEEHMKPKHDADRSDEKPELATTHIVEEGNHIFPSDFNVDGVDVRTNYVVGRQHGNVPLKTKVVDVFAQHNKSLKRGEVHLRNNTKQSGASQFHHDNPQNHNSDRKHTRMVNNNNNNKRRDDISKPEYPRRRKKKTNDRKKRNSLHPTLPSLTITASPYNISPHNRRRNIV
eukprot:m.169111 g.169111  ORF g.169111 m.169111 type:complete len:1174 (-) comp13474_c0_seq1:427-3948(-)